jgi:hypothetical protein
MKKIILLALLVGTLSSCETNTKTEKEIMIEGQNSAANFFKPRMVTIEIEGCQSLFTTYGHAVILTHKGNCKNPIHRK